MKIVLLIEKDWLFIIIFIKSMWSFIQLIRGTFYNNKCENCVHCVSVNWRTLD